MVVLELLAAVVTTALAVLTATGTVGRNRFVGVRMPTTMRSDDAWRRAHRAALVPTVIAGAVTSATCVVSVAAGRADDPLAVILCAVPLLVGALWSVVAANRAVR